MNLRGQYGGKADDMQRRMQESIIANGMEDAIAPYLESMTSVLKDIDEHGMANGANIIAAFGQLASLGTRTPEQLAQLMGGIDGAIKGSSGEANAFFQQAFRGFGNGTIGATKLNTSAGGLFGLSREGMADKGYSNAEISSFGRMGMFANGSQRAGAIMEQLGLKDASLSSLNDSQRVGAAQMGNRLFGTQGMGGYESLKILEQLKNGDITQSTADKRLKAIKENEDPVVQKLNKLNSTTHGQTQILEMIQANTLEALGGHLMPIYNTLVGFTTQFDQIFGALADWLGADVDATNSHLKDTAYAGVTYNEKTRQFQGQEALGPRGYANKEAMESQAQAKKMNQDLARRKADKDFGTGSLLNPDNKPVLVEFGQDTITKLARTMNRENKKNGRTKNGRIND